MARRKSNKTNIIGGILLGLAFGGLVLRVLNLIDSMDMGAIWGFLGLAFSGWLAIVSKDDDGLDTKAELDSLRQMIEELKNKDK